VKIYVITQGAYSDYHIVAIVQGEGDLPALYLAFTQKHNLVDYEDVPLTRTNWPEWSPSFDSRQEAIEGTPFNNIHEMFIDWIVAEHGFVVVDYEEMVLG